MFEKHDYKPTPQISSVQFAHRRNFNHQKTQLKGKQSTFNFGEIKSNDVIHNQP